VVQHALEKTRKQVDYSDFAPLGSVRADGGMVIAACGDAPSSCSPRAKDLEAPLMKKNDLSELGSNLLIFGSVSVAFAPFVLGDRLILVVSGLIQEGSVMLHQFTNYVSWLIS
jgi:hypothetical protein